MNDTVICGLLAIVTSKGRTPLVVDLWPIKLLMVMLDNMVHLSTAFEPLSLKLAWYSPWQSTNTLEIERHSM